MFQRDMVPKTLQHPTLQLLLGKPIRGGTVMIPLNMCYSQTRRNAIIMLFNEELSPNFVLDGLGVD
jgi:hypothetical protein